MKRVIQVLLLLCVCVSCALKATTTSSEGEPGGKKDFCAQSVSYFGPDLAGTFQWMPDGLAGTFQWMSDSLAGTLQWMAEVSNRYELHRFGRPLLYSTLVVIPLFPFLCIMLPSEKTLLQEKERLERLAELEAENQRKQEGETSAPMERRPPRTRPRKLRRYRKSCNADSSNMTHGPIVIRIAAADRNLSDERRNEPVNVVTNEEVPDVSTNNSANDSYTRLKGLATRIYGEPTVGKTCVVVACGAAVSYGIYRLLKG